MTRIVDLPELTAAASLTDYTRIVRPDVPGAVKGKEYRINPHNFPHRWGRAFHFEGTLTADLDIRFAMPVGASLKKISARTSNDSNSDFSIGASTNPSAIFAGASPGDNNIPNVFTSADFNGASANDGYIAEGSIIIIYVDYDGLAGTAAADLTMDLDFVS